MKNICNLALRLSLLLLLSCFCSNGFSQLQYTQKFTRLLRKCDASFIAPIEGHYKIRMPRGSEPVDFDLVLESEDKAFELRYQLDPNYHLDIPHISFMTSASSLAINEDRFDIEMNVFTLEQSRSLFGADWAAYADFIPKPSITKKRYGRIVTVFKSDKGLMQTIMFFDDHEEEKDRRLYSLSFENVASELE